MVVSLQLLFTIDIIIRLASSVANSECQRCGTFSRPNTSLHHVCPPRHPQNTAFLARIDRPSCNAPTNWCKSRLGYTLRTDSRVLLHTAILRHVHGIEAPILRVIKNLHTYIHTNMHTHAHTPMRGKSAITRAEFVHLPLAHVLHAQMAHSTR
jgi:hypothetical protein